MKTAKLWDAKTHTRIPNNLLRWLICGTNTPHEVKAALLIARLSLGFHRKKTIGRLDLPDFVSLLKCDRATVSRAITALRKRRKIFRYDRQGNHFYYSLYGPKAIHDDRNATPHDPNATPPAQVATSHQATVAAVQRSSEENEHISSVMQRVTAGSQTTNMQPSSGVTKKAVKENLKERFKEPLAGSAPASAEASASPASAEQSASPAAEPPFNLQKPKRRGYDEIIASPPPPGLVDTIKQSGNELAP